MIGTFEYVALFVPILIAVAPAVIKKIIIWFIKNVYRIHKFIFYGRYRYTSKDSIFKIESNNFSSRVNENISLLEDVEKLLDSITGVSWRYKAMAYKKISSALLEEKKYMPSKKEYLFTYIYASILLFCILEIYILACTDKFLILILTALSIIFIAVNAVRAWKNDSKQDFKHEKNADPLGLDDISSNYLILYILSILDIQDKSIEKYLNLEETRGIVKNKRPRIPKGYLIEIQNLKEEYRYKYEYFIPPIISGIYLIPDEHRESKVINLLSTREHFRKYLGSNNMETWRITIFVGVGVILLACKMFGVDSGVVYNWIFSLLLK